MPDTSIRSYRAKRDFTVTAEPPPRDEVAAGGQVVAVEKQAMFVVQKHRARRAGLHWDFRLEHGGVLWSWAVPKGPSLDPADKRMAIHVEDHPLDYAGFQGSIPDGQYGAGEVETWDRGTWTPIDDPEYGMAKGHLHFTLQGERLRGRFSLVRSGRRGAGKAEAWFLIKAADEHSQAGRGAAEMEQAPLPPVRAKGQAPAPGAKRGALPEAQAPQLCSLVRVAPEGGDWLSEIKFDGYRILASIRDGVVRLLTRNGLDWADRMPALAAAFRGLGVGSALIDGELVALRADGVSSFPGLQEALKAGRDGSLSFYAFDLLHLDGWDLRPCPLRDRKAALAPLVRGAMLRFSEHVEGEAAALHAQACKSGLEGIVCKRAGEPYRAGRGPGWVKVKCQGREEMVVVGWTPPGGSRTGFGALHVGYYDAEGRLHYAGGVGSGFDTADLGALRARLDGMGVAAPSGMLVSGDPVDGSVAWVRPELVIEVEFTGWSGAGRLRHPVFLGVREDKAAGEVVRDVADVDAPRAPLRHGRPGARTGRGWHGAVPPVAKPDLVAARGVRIVTAKAPGKAKTRMGGVDLTHPERALWPGITKLDLAEYWRAVAAHALPGLSRRPLSIVRCPDGIEGERFFQKNGHGYLPAQIREGKAGSQPYLAIDDADGLFAMAQMSAIELHPWGAPESDPMRPDRLVFDLDPGEGVAFGAVVAAAKDVRARLGKLGLESFCRTTGGKGLHVVAPLTPDAMWDAAKPFCRAFAEAMAQESPELYVAHVKIADRRGKILVDWLRNGLGATAVASFCPRARPGAGVATPLAWREVGPKLDPGAFTVLTVPGRLARLKTDPWAGYDALDQRLPQLAAPKPPDATPPVKTGPARIVTARKPKPR